jgi:protein-S-isoprenylcysteine O-methyltransferase Ste14
VIATHHSQSGLLRLVLSYWLIAALVLAAIFFLPAGSFAYWEAWVYMGIVLIPALCILVYFVKASPELLERRLRFRERETTQKRIIFASYFLLATFLLPGFDRRWGWSDVPTPIVLIASLLVLLGYGLVVRVFLENRYASRVIEVEAEQQVIGTGPYAVIRHPMYLGACVMYLATPLALGSYWAMIPAVFIFPILVARILNEEQVLEKELKGYLEYEQKVRYRLIPRIW